MNRTREKLFAGLLVTILVPVCTEAFYPSLTTFFSSASNLLQKNICCSNFQKRGVADYGLAYFKTLIDLLVLDVRNKSRGLWRTDVKKAKLFAKTYRENCLNCRDKSCPNRPLIKDIKGLQKTILHPKKPFNHKNFSFGIRIAGLDEKAKKHGITQELIKKE